MGISSGINRFLYPLTGSLLVFMANSFFPVLWQSAATGVFGPYVGNPALQEYLLDGIVIFAFFVAGWASTRGLRGEGANRHMHYMKSQGKG